VAECRLPEEYEELVVIENGSRAGAEQLVEELPARLNARYMHRERGNKSYALNEALDTITDGLVVLFDDDVQVHPDTLEAYAEAAQNHGPGYFYGGPVDVDREKEPPEWLEPFLPYSAKGYDLKNERMWNEYLGFNWAAFSRDILALGGFDPRFGPGSPLGASGQESDMQKRMLDEGVEGKDVPDALVWHYVPASRCTPEWVLRRTFGKGVRDGIRRGTSIEVIKASTDLAKYLVRWLLYKLSSDDREIYRSKIAVNGKLGFIKGTTKVSTECSIFIA
jgi:glycosyltransferase involved in cell wall biosynthesis